MSTTVTGEKKNLPPLVRTSSYAYANLSPISTKEGVTRNISSPPPPYPPHPTPPPHPGPRKKLEKRALVRVNTYADIMPELDSLFKTHDHTKFSHSKIYIIILDPDERRRPTTTTVRSNDTLVDTPFQLISGFFHVNQGVLCC